MRSRFAIFFPLGLAFMFAGCGPDERILRSGNDQPAAGNIERRVPTIAEDIEAMKTAEFDVIYVLRRRDGGMMDAEDKNVIRANTADANRRVSAEDGRAFLIGSNTPLSSKSLSALYARFSVEDHSKPAGSENSNSSGTK